MDYAKAVHSLRPIKRLGQNFLMNRDIAKAEANFGIGRNVLEIGPGLGVLTTELCKQAESVLAVEKDQRLYSMLKSGLRSRKLRLINADFFELPEGELEGRQIMISNIPYSMSSKTIGWLSAHHMPAVLCLQREFIRHMVAKPGGRDYSRLSVTASISFAVTLIMDVGAGNFYPVPRVDSGIVYLRPAAAVLDRDLLDLITLVMNHKKKRVRNAIVDSWKALGLDRASSARLALGAPYSDERPFQLQPKQILEIASYLKSELPRQA